MAWNKVPDPTPEAVKTRLEGDIEHQKANIQQAERIITCRKKQLLCEHKWKYDKGIDLGGESTLDISCENCGYIWY